MPVWLSKAAQCLLGCALRHRAFRARFPWRVRTASSRAAMLSGLIPATLVLGMAPGGIAEMCVTAKVLQLGVPLVTAFHVTRVVVDPARRRTALCRCSKLRDPFAAPESDPEIDR